MSLEKSLQEQAQSIREEAKKNRLRSAAGAHEDPIPTNSLAKKRLNTALIIVSTLMAFAAIVLVTGLYSIHPVVLSLLLLLLAFLAEAWARSCSLCGSFRSMRSIGHGTWRCKHCEYREAKPKGYF
jgi:hypothetical protein